MFSKNVFIFLLFIIIFQQIYPLIIPLNSIKNVSSANGLLEILDSFKNNIKYSYITIGFPRQRFQIIYTSIESTNNIKGEKCFPDSFYNYNLSTTKQFAYEQNELNYFSVNDFISFDNSHNNYLMNFLYYNSTINKKENCGNIGLGYATQKEEEHNLFFQLKKFNAINKNIFYVNYTNNNEILLNIGLEPFDIDNSYSKNVTTIEIAPIIDYEVKPGKTRKYDWNLNISRIFYFKKIPLQSNVDPYVEISRMKTRKLNFFQALLVPEEDLIKGPFEYQESIDKNFFDDLISDNICKKIKFENKYYYYCNKEHKNLIKNTFPSIYFYQSDINYIFELTYEDLFLEKNDYIFFGIYFDTFLIEVFEGAYISEWNFGKIFLKKYSFAFDLENRKLMFYKKNKFKKEKKPEEKMNPDENKSSNRKIYQLGLILVVITIGVFAFLLDRFVKKKYRVNNLLIDFDNREA